MKRTYVDSGVLIAAWRGEERLASHALQILDDPGRELIVSDYVRLEVIPQPTFHQNHGELEFMEAVLSQAGEDVVASPEVTSKALEMASKHAIAPMDALHIGAALVSCADEVVTVEKPTKPMCRLTEVKVVSLRQSPDCSD